MKDVSRYARGARDEAAKKAQSEAASIHYTANSDEIKRRSTAWYNANTNRVKQTSLQWRKDNPKKVKQNAFDNSNKKGKYYKQSVERHYRPIPHAKAKVRGIHKYLYGKYKKIIDPNGLTHIHHEWIPDTADFRGVALVEKDQHLHGFIDVIEILEGKITVFTEKGVREQC